MPWALGSFLSDTFFKSFSSKYVYVEGSLSRISPVYTVLVQSACSSPGGGPLQMLLTLTLNLLPASPKNSATGPTFGPF
jgi:hypothetical protein